MSNESKPDLTHAEARAEVEAFFGPEWRVNVVGPDDDLSYYIVAYRGAVKVAVFADSYRASVSALKQAWRDAVRPWVLDGIIRYETHRCEHTPEEVASRVLGEEA